MATAVFVPAYCLRHGSKLIHLTTMSNKSVRRAAELVRKGKAEYIILSTAYKNLWEYEMRLKQTLLRSLGIDAALIRVIPHVTNSYDEIAGTRHLVEGLNIDTIIVVADKWHEPRAMEVFQLLFPDLTVFGCPFTTSRYEFTEEPSMIKSIRGGVAPLWIAWNLLFWFLTPMLTRRFARFTKN